MSGRLAVQSSTYKGELRPGRNRLISGAASPSAALAASDSNSSDDIEGGRVPMSPDAVRSPQAVRAALRIDAGASPSLLDPRRSVNTPLSDSATVELASSDTVVPYTGPTVRTRSRNVAPPVDDAADHTHGSSGAAGLSTEQARAQEQAAIDRVRRRLLEQRAALAGRRPEVMRPGQSATPRTTVPWRMSSFCVSIRVRTMDAAAQAAGMGHS